MPQLLPDGLRPDDHLFIAKCAPHPPGEATVYSRVVPEVD